MRYLHGPNESFEAAEKYATIVRKRKMLMGYHFSVTSQMRDTGYPGLCVPEISVGLDIDDKALERRIIDTLEEMGFEEAKSNPAYNASRRG